MLKIRYFRLRLPSQMEFEGFVEAAYDVQVGGSVAVLRASPEELVLRYKVTRYIQTLQISDDGSELKISVPTVEQYSLRFFMTPKGVLVSFLDPPRGSRVTTDLLSLLFGNKSYFIEALEISALEIKSHIAAFDSARLVSAKVRDFRVYDNAIGRLEISAREGLSDELAPFLLGKYYKVDSLTYEVTHQFKRGLICYSSTGSIRVSGPLVETAFTLFEQLI